MIDIHFSGCTPEEIKDAMRSFLKTDEPAIHVFDTCADYLDQIPTVTVTPTDEPETPAKPETPAEPETTGPSMEEARAALNELRQKKGPAAVREILTAHNVSSFTDLNPSEYAQVIEEAKQ